MIYSFVYSCKDWAWTPHTSLDNAGERERESPSRKFCQNPQLNKKTHLKMGGKAEVIEIARRFHGDYLKTMKSQYFPQ